MTERRPSAGTSQAEKSDTATFPTASTMIPSANTSEKNASLLTKASGVLLLCYIVFCFSRDLPAAVTSIYNAHPIFSDKSVVDGPAVGDSGGKVDVVWAPETLNGIPNDVREYWMGRAVQHLYDKLDTKCPWAAFAGVIVNHSDTTGPFGDFGREICLGVNAVPTKGDPTLHGEIANIQNCTTILSLPPYSLPAGEIPTALSTLSIYTTGEPCPMCASSIRWSNFKECIFATSIDKLMELGWFQIDIRSHEVFSRSWTLRTERMTGLLGGVLKQSVDRLFAWQFTEDGECPRGCGRVEDGEGCVKV